MPNRVVLAWLLGAACAAAADDASPDVRFAVLDRQDASSRAGVEVTWVGVAVARRVTLLRLDPHVAYVHPRLGVGGYVHMPLSVLSDAGTTDAGTGGLELGGIVARAPTPELSGVAHVALVLPTASAAAVDANTIASIARLPDLILAVPRATSVRVGVSPVVRTRGVFARADLGFDVNLAADQPEREPLVLHIAGGVGYDSPAGLVAVETAHLRLGGASARWLDVIAISARFHAGAFHPYVAIALPLDADATANVTAAATLGVDAQLF
jgi:hypothetical protein